MNSIHRMSFVKVKGTDAVFVVRKIVGDKAFIINIRHGNEIMFPLEDLKLIDNPKDIVDAINLDLVDAIEGKLGFEVGDLVKVNGYSSIFTIIDHNESKTEFKVKQYLLEEVAPELVAYPEDMTLADIEEIEEYEQMAIVPMEFKPFDRVLGTKKENKKKSNFRNKEIDVLKKLEHNRKILERLKLWQDWFFEAYQLTGDKKYIRRIKRVQKWINKIPTRAYQIK